MRRNKRKARQVVAADVAFERKPSEEQVTELLKTLRSVCAFREKPLGKDTIEKIINEVRFAPGGHNSQRTVFFLR